MVRQLNNVREMYTQPMTKHDLLPCTTVTVDRADISVFNVLVISWVILLQWK